MSPGTSAVSSPSRSRTWDVFTNRFMWRRTAPVSSQMLRYSDGWRRSSSSRTARTLEADSKSSEAPSQQSRSAAGTSILIVVSLVMGEEEVERRSICAIKMRFYNRQHHPYCGIDLHVKTMYVCILDAAGQMLVHWNVKSPPEALLGRQVFAALITPRHHAVSSNAGR